MIIKKFIGKTELEASQAAKKELGENMVIMNVRFVKPKGFFSAFKKKQVEVTAALEDDEEPIRQIRKIAHSIQNDKSEKNDKTATQNQQNQGVGSSIDLKAGEANLNIEKRLDNLQSLLENQISRENDAVKMTEKNASKAEKAFKDDADKSGDSKTHSSSKEEELDEQDKEIDRFLRLLYNTMIDNEVDEHFVNEIIGEAQKNKKPGVTMDFILGNIYQKMILKFGKSEGIRPAENKPRIVFFIGPTGVGKTTTIAKVASSFSVNEKKKIALLTTDTYRIAATDQLRTYAGILEVPFRVIYEPTELLKAVSDFEDCDYIFVDSAGHSHKNEELLNKQKEYLDIVGDYEKQIFLVLSATTKHKDLKKIAANYKDISDYQLIFTKLDETGEYGNIYNMRCETGASIAYITYGQNVPDDIEVFNAQKTVKMLLGGKN